MRDNGIVLYRFKCEAIMKDKTDYVLVYFISEGLRESEVAEVISRTRGCVQKRLKDLRYQYNARTNSQLIKQVLNDHSDLNLDNICTQEEKNNFLRRYKKCLSLVENIGIYIAKTNIKKLNHGKLAS